MATLRTGPQITPQFLPGTEPLQMLLQGVASTAASSRKSNAGQDDSKMAKTFTMKSAQLEKQRQNNEAEYAATRASFEQAALKSPSPEKYIQDNWTVLKEAQQKYTNQDIAYRAQIAPEEEAFDAYTSHIKNLYNEGATNETPVYDYRSGHDTGKKVGDLIQEAHLQSLGEQPQYYSMPNTPLITKTWNAITTGLGNYQKKGSTTTIKLNEEFKETEKVYNSFLDGTTQSNAINLETAYNTFRNDINLSDDLSFAFNVMKEKHIKLAFHNNDDPESREYYANEFEREFKEGKIGTKYEPLIQGEDTIENYAEIEDQRIKDAKAEKNKPVYVNFGMAVAFGQYEYWDLKPKSRIFDLMDRTKTPSFSASINGLANDVAGSGYLKEGSSYLSMIKKDGGLSTDDAVEQKNHERFINIYNADLNTANQEEEVMRRSGATEEQINNMRHRWEVNSVFAYATETMTPEEQHDYLLNEFGYDNTDEYEDIAQSDFLRIEAKSQGKAVKRIKKNKAAVGDLSSYDILRYGAVIEWGSFPHEEWKDSYNRAVDLTGDDIMILGNRFTAEKNKDKKGNATSPFIAWGADNVTSAAPLGKNGEIAPAIEGKVFLREEALENVEMERYDPNTDKMIKVSLKDLYDQYGEELGWGHDNYKVRDEKMFAVLDDNNMLIDDPGNKGKYITVKGYLIPATFIYKHLPSDIHNNKTTDVTLPQQAGEYFQGDVPTGSNVINTKEQ